MADFVDSDDWRAKCDSTADTIAAARTRALFVDVHFLVGPPPSTRFFNAHKMVLAGGSPVFEAMLFGQLAERGDSIALPDDDPEAFEIMLKHLYGECIAFPSIVAACKSYHLGDKYLIPRLQSESADFIRASTMDEENFWGIIEYDLLRDNIFLEEKLFRYIERNADKLIKAKEFQNVPEYVILTFLRMETMELSSEYELLSSVTKWFLKRFPQSKPPVYQDQHLKQYFQFIRFSVLTPREFCLFTEKFPNVLNASTSLKILKHLNDPSNYDLPAWCSVNKVVRKPAKPEQPPLKTHVHVRSTHTVRTCRPNI